MLSVGRDTGGLWPQAASSHMLAELTRLGEVLKNCIMIAKNIAVFDGRRRSLHLLAGGIKSKPPDGGWL